MSKVREVVHTQRELDKLNEKKKELLEKQRVAIQRTFIECESCKKKSRLGQWTFFQEHWYTAPFSCAGGDYWNTSDVKVCHIGCPKCGAENYIYNHFQKDKIINFIEKYPFCTEELFKEVQERYKD